MRRRPFPSERIWSLLVAGLTLSLFLGAGLIPVPEAGASPDPLVNYAVYHRVADTDRLGANIPVSVMSGDGNQFAFIGVKPDKRFSLYTVNADGTGLNEIPLTMLEGRAIAELAISRDGGRVFMNTGGLGSRLYVAEGGSVKMILDGAEHKGFEILERIQCTADGRFLCFLNRQGYGGDVWKVAHDGSGLSMVLDDNQLSHAEAKGGKGYRVLEFGISADGSTVAFLLEGWFDPANIHVRHSRPELFLLRGGSVTQLTHYEAASKKYYLAVSDDGTTAAMMVAQPVNHWVAVRLGDGTITPLGAPRGGGKSALSGDGNLLFLIEDSGTLIRTDGSGVMGLLAVFNIPLAVHDHPCISDDGTRVGFRFGYSAWPFKEAVYVGTFMDGPGPMGAAPEIAEVTFDPNFMPRGDPKAAVRLSVGVTDPQGPDNLFRVQADPMIKGVRQNASLIPANFNRTPNDAGVNGDPTANDGIFTSIGFPGPKINEIDVMTIRIGAMDKDGNTAVSCVQFGIGAPAVGAPAAEEESGPAVGPGSPSPDQRALIDDLGPPQGFSLSFYVEEGSSAIVRSELWYYYDILRSFTFLDGRLITSHPMDPRDEGSVAAPYKPWQFQEGMSFDDVVVQLAAQTFIQMELDDELIQGANLYYAEQLVMGFKDDSLVYVETIPVPSE